MSIWNYVVTAHKPTNVTHSCVGNFTGPQELNLIIAKCTRIEIHLLTPQGLQRQYQEELAKEMAQIGSQTPERKQPPPLNKVDVWLRVVGPPKKRMTVYGMGSLSYSCLEKSTAYRSSSSSSCSSAQPSDYVQTTEFQQSVEESVPKALSMYLRELKEANEYLKSEVASLIQQVRQLKGLDQSQDVPSNDP